MLDIPKEIPHNLRLLDMVSDNNKTYKSLIEDFNNASIDAKNLGIGIIQLAKNNIDSFKALYFTVRKIGKSFLRPGVTIEDVNKMNIYNEVNLRFTEIVFTGLSKGANPIVGNTYRIDYFPLCKDNDIQPSLLAFREIINDAIGLFLYRQYLNDIITGIVKIDEPKNKIATEKNELTGKQLVLIGIYNGDIFTAKDNGKYQYRLYCHLLKAENRKGDSNSKRKTESLINDLEIITKYLKDKPLAKAKEELNAAKTVLEKYL